MYVCFFARIWFGKSSLHIFLCPFHKKQKQNKFTSFYFFNSVLVHSFPSPLTSVHHASPSFSLPYHPLLHSFHLYFSLLLPLLYSLLSSICLFRSSALPHSLGIMTPRPYLAPKLTGYTAALSPGTWEGREERRMWWWWRRTNQWACTVIEFVYSLVFYLGHNTQAPPLCILRPLCLSHSLTLSRLSPPIQIVLLHRFLLLVLFANFILLALSAHSLHLQLLFHLPSFPSPYSLPLPLPPPTPSLLLFFLDTARFHTKVHLATTVHTHSHRGDNCVCLGPFKILAPFTG